MKWFGIVGLVFLTFEMILGLNVGGTTTPPGFERKMGKSELDYR